MILSPPLKPEIVLASVVPVGLFSRSTSLVPENWKMSVAFTDPVIVRLAAVPIAIVAALSQVLDPLAVQFAPASTVTVPKFLYWEIVPALVPASSSVLVAAVLLSPAMVPVNTAPGSAITRLPPWPLIPPVKATAVPVVPYELTMVPALCTVPVSIETPIWP